MNLKLYCLLSLLFLFGAWPLASAADGPRTTLSELESIKIGAGAISVVVRFTAPGNDWTGTLLSRRAKPGEPSLCVTAFRHEPFGKRFLGFAMDGIANGPNQAAVLTVRDNVIGGHLICAFTEMTDELNSGTHELVFRCDGTTSELFIDGIRRESRNAEKFTARTYLKLYPYAAVGWKKNAEPDGRDRFEGVVDEVKVWTRNISDEEVKSASGGRFSVPSEEKVNPKTLALGLYSSSMSDEQRMAAIDESIPSWLQKKLANDPWFPRFHVAIPAGMMFDSRCTIHGGRFHLFPTWRADINLSTGLGSSFRMMHASSSDLIHWKFDPFPMRLENTDVCNGSPTTIDGVPNFFFLRYQPGSAGAPYRVLPSDDSLLHWSLPDPQPRITAEGQGYAGRLDSVVFQDNGKYYLTGTRRNANNPNMAMPLYRSDDLANWKYVGDFLQTDTGKNFNECPQIFHVDGKMVVAAFYPLRSPHDNYLVGRFENEKFIPEAGGHWDHGGHGHDRSFDADRHPDGRVIGWSTISVYSEHDAIETARLGWKGMHSLPKVVTLRHDRTLALQPAKEIELLRGGKTDDDLPKDHQGCFEIQCAFEKASGLALTGPDGEVGITFDPRTRILTADTSRAPKRGSDTGRLFKTTPLSGDGPVTARIFFDRSVLEVFVGGMVLTLRHFPSEPDAIQLRQNGLTQISSWSMQSIWSDLKNRDHHAWEKQMQPAKWKFKTRGEDNFSPDKQPYKSPLLLREEAEKNGTPSAPSTPKPSPSPPPQPPKPQARTTTFKDSSVIWHMDAGSTLTARGNAKLGIELTSEERAASLARGGDGFAAQLDGGHLMLPELGDVFDHGEYTLHLRVNPAGETLDGSLFSSWSGKEHMPIDFSAWRMPWGHLSTHGISFRTSFKRSVAAGQAAVLDFYCPTPEPLKGWLDLTVRLESGTLDLFVNGELLFRNAEKLPGGLPYEFFLNETPGAIIGAQPGDRWPFRGLVDHVAIWRKPLTDGQVLELAGLKHDGAALKPKRLHTKDALGQYHLPSDTPDEQRAALTNDELKKAIAHQIEHDPWYPQYHMALIGLPCNLHSLYHRGRHHYMLIHRGEALNHNEVFRHLVSDDLVKWDIRPAPLGWPHPIWPNGTFLHGPDGKPAIVGGYPITLAVAEDDNLDHWRVLNDDVRITIEHPNYVDEPRKAPGKLSWEEGNTWKQDGVYYMVGGGSHWDSVDANGKLARHHHDAADYDFPLYRSRDLREWEHIGSFFKNPDPEKLNLGVECGQMIPLSDGRYLWDFTHTYLVGRIEQNRFIMEHSGTLCEKGNFVHWGGWERHDDGRLLFQTTKILKLPVNELARLGWGRTHRLPLVANVERDGRLTLEPVAELQKLRRQPAALGELAGAHQEAELTFTMPTTGRIGLRFGDGQNTLDIYVDGDKRSLVVDPRRLPDEANHIPNDKRLVTQPLTAKPGEQQSLRVFLDGALIEVFCNKQNSVHWSWFSIPDIVKAELIADSLSKDTEFKSQVWPMGTIWTSSAP